MVAEYFVTDSQSDRQGKTVTVYYFLILWSVDMITGILCGFNNIYQGFIINFHRFFLLKPCSNIVTTNLSDHKLYNYIQVIRLLHMDFRMEFKSSECELCLNTLELISMNIMQGCKDFNVHFKSKISYYVR